MNAALIIKPIGGMGNRLYAMASAREFALNSGRDLTVFWTLRWELNALFTDFWEPNGFRLVYADEYNMPWRWLNKPRLRERFLSAGATVITDEEMYRIRDEIGGYDYESYLQRFSDTPKLFMETCFNFYPKRQTPLNHIFIPNQDIRAELKRWEEEHGSGHIGMHIRRTDHGDAIGASPDRLFEQVVDEAAQDARVFLCTDDPNTEARFRARYGDRILTYSKNKSRDTREGIRSAVMDMLLLSRSSRVYGSFKSTFSSFAADYGQIPLTVLTE